MRYYIIINGVNSLAIPGLAIRTLPPISKPAMRNLREEIDGRDGDITTELGYGAYDKTLEIGLFGDYDIDRIISFFNTKGTIIFSDEPDKYYNFEIVDKIDYTKLVKFRTATINIHCQPFKYPVSEEPQVEEYEYVEGTGEALTLDNTSEAIFNKIELQGNTYQTQYTGINKFNKDGNLSTFQAAGNQSTITKTNEKITFVTTGQNAAGFYVTSNIWHNYVDNFDSTKTYTISADVTLSASAQLKFGVESNATFQTYSGKQRITNTTNASSINAAIVVYLYNNTIGTQVTVENIQIEEGTTAHDFVPYVGGIPSPNPQFPQPVNVVSGDNEIKINGANPLDNSKIVKGRLDNGVIGYESGTTALTTTTNSVSFTTNTSYRGIVTDYIPIMASSYIYSVYDSADQTIGQVLSFYDKDKNFISQLNGGSITNGKRYANNVSNAKYCRIWYYLSSAGTTTINDLQVRFSSGETAPTYEPYIGSSYHITLPSGIELCKIGTFQDYIYKTDKWLLHKEIGKVVLNGSEYWSSATDTTNLFINSSTLFNGKYLVQNGYSNNFKNIVNTDITNNFTANNNLADNQFTFRNGTKDRIYIKSSVASNSNDFKTWLSTHNTIVYYVLANPTNTEITDTTLISQLEELKNATSYEGQTNITQTNNDLPFILDLSTLELGSDHLVINNQGNIYSKPKLDLEGSGIVDIYLNDSQILEADLTEAGEIVIDTEAMEATNPSTGLLANRQVTGDYSRIKLDPGENDLRFSGNLTKATITNYERWL